MQIKKNAPPVDINQRRAINGADADVIQLYPMKHEWAWQYYNDANSNHWLPTEISMQLLEHIFERRRYRHTGLY